LAVAVIFIGNCFSSRSASAQTVRTYDLEIVGTDIDYGGGNIWHAWTFKNAGEPTGSVPGPTLTVNAGEKLVVHVKNNLDLMHSFHSHLSGYDQEDDGAQTNIISGNGTGAMIPPGGEWTYTFEPKQPGVYYYHCHSADGGLMISQHIHQGLYGAIIVKDPHEKPVRDEVLFMGETGQNTEGDNVPQYIMNGLGLPGGEHTLETAYKQGGFDAVAANLGVTVPTFQAKTGEKLRLNIVNIGDQIHTFHPHNVDIYSLGALGGRQWPANVVPLLPGAADQVTVTFEKPGLWLFHCHVVNHADAGMIGLFVVEEGSTLSTKPQGSGTGNVSPSGAATATPAPTETAAAGSSTLDIHLTEFKLTGPTGDTLPSLTAGPVDVQATNDGTTPHDLVILKTDTDQAALPVAGSKVDEDAAGQVIGKLTNIGGGATKQGTFSLDAGNYVLICNVPGHYQLGMHTALIVQ
jgi:uncharacterized cupredoxin-like copper-binding protein